MLNIELSDLVGGLTGGATFYLLMKLHLFKERIRELARRSKLDQGDDHD